MKLHFEYIFQQYNFLKKTLESLLLGRRVDMAHHRGNQI